MTSPKPLWGSEDWKALRDAKLMHWFGGDRDAVNMLMLLSDITELWDDLIDKDKQVSDGAIHDGFFKVIVSLPNNPFYLKHRAFLTPIIIQSIASWRTANSLATGSRSERALSYTLRNADIQLVTAIVYLTRGQQAMIDIGPVLWTEFAAKQDDIDKWLEARP